MKIVFDIEADGLLDTITKIHVFSYYSLEDKTTKSLTRKEDILSLLASVDVVIGHNIIDYDIPALEKIFEVDLSHIKKIDTLFMSYYLYPEMEKHGLEAWGKAIGITKVEIKDWINLSIEEYTQRCEVDVQINVELFHKFYNYFAELYPEGVQSVLNYLNFIAECLRIQSENGFYLDKKLCISKSEELTLLIKNKVDILSEIMPPGKLVKSIPKVLYKKDGMLSSHGEKWFEYLQEHDLPIDTKEIREKGSPTSHSQLKSWLFSLGWIPQTFTVSKATGEKIPQVSLPYGQGLCSSIKFMFEQYPFLEELDSLFMLQHRKSIFTGYLEVEKNGYVYASAGGLANTHRLKHRAPLVNLPDIAKPFGKDIRGALTVEDDDEILIGFDVKALEDSTKQHYMMFYTPDVVNAMRIPGFDPHLNIAILAGFITEEESEFYKWYQEENK